jgi:hypothetical protein
MRNNPEANVSITVMQTKWKIRLQYEMKHSRRSVKDILVKANVSPQDYRSSEKTILLTQIQLSKKISKKSNFKVN